jgi:3-hydroxyisobutyrate dehydrogenase
MNQHGTVAVLGTGIMGGPMAANLVSAGWDVRVWNRTREKAERLVDRGAHLADAPARAAAGADFVLTMLADGDAVEDVMSGEDGALGAIDDDAVWLQMSTVGIDATERLSALATDRGVAFVDAPVSGTRQPAERGELMVLAAGPEALRPRCAPVFDAVAQEVRWVGEEPGAGSRFKLVLNAWLLSLTETLSETIELARALGVDPAQFLDAVDGGPLGFGYAQLKGKPMIALAFDEVAFPLAMAAKDARLVRDAVARAALTLPFLAALEDQYGRAVELGHGDEDLAAVHHAVRPGGC